MSPSASARKISYRLKEATKCPACGTEHFKEEMLSGSGRLNAGKLMPDLRRLYEPTKKWGKVQPLNYIMQVCPKCLFTAFSKDFESLNANELQAIKTTTPHRMKLVETVFGKLNMDDDREDAHGAASYMLAIDCYHLRTADIAPTPKKAVCCIRAAWLLDDLAQDFPQRPFNKAADFYYTQAAKEYGVTLELMQNGAEPVELALPIMGPSIDFNFAFDGIVYLNSYLTRKYINDIAKTPQDKIKVLDTAKRYLSKLYGSGKASKNKPVIMIDMSKEMFDDMGSMIEKLNEEIGNPPASQPETT
ncbi:MAG: DUF2225 domain-containing protein [Leptospiraceae bacterium]|nr:DUF2225 domain-containing protein [Leptospiraceae bacterium]